MSDERNPTTAFSICDPRIDYLRYPSKYPGDKWVAYLKAGYAHPTMGDVIQEERLGDLAVRMSEVAETVGDADHG